MRTLKCVAVCQQDIINYDRLITAIEDEGEAVIFNVNGTEEDVDNTSSVVFDVHVTFFRACRKPYTCGSESISNTITMSKMLPARLFF